MLICFAKKVDMIFHVFQENEQRTSIREDKSQTVNTVSVHDMKPNTLTYMITTL